MNKPRLPGTVSPPRSTLDQHSDHLQALGMISVEISNLEITLAELLAALLHINKWVGHVVYLTPQTGAGRLKILQNVIEDVIEPETKTKKRLVVLISKARLCLNKRNEYIHGAWGLSTKNKKLVVKRAIPFRSIDLPKVVPLKELTDFLEKVRDLTEHVAKETEAIFASWPPYTWQETSAGPLRQNRSLVTAPQSFDSLE